MNPCGLFDSGDLEPRGDPTERRDRLRAKILKSLPPTLPPAETEWQTQSPLTLSVSCTINRGHWRWGWPPLEAECLSLQMQQISLYRRDGPRPGWQAYYYAPQGQEPLSKDQAIERLIDLIEDHFQSWIQRK